MLGPQAEIVVAELVPAVVAWARGPMAELFGDSLTDPRVRIRETDVGELIRRGTAGLRRDPARRRQRAEGLTREANDRLYDLDGLGTAYRALRRGGMLSVWSSAPDPEFTLRLHKTGFDVKEIPLRAKGPRGGARHFIWTAARPD